MRLGLAFLVVLAAACLPPAGVRYPQLPKVADGALHVIVFDVGQADAMLVLYRGKSLLVDAGAARFAPQLAAQRIPRRLDALLGSRRLDYAVVTHYHRDHAGAAGRTLGNREPSGLFALIEREGLKVDTLLDHGDAVIGPAGATQKQYEQAVQSWIAMGAVRERRTLRAGDAIDMGRGLDVRVIASGGNGQLERVQALFPSLAEYPPTQNDYSVSLKLTLGDFELVSSGDLSGANVLREFGSRKESYNDLESRLAGDVGPVEVYRVHHHGSSHSSNACFVQVLEPAVSIISSGKNNYGHPDPGVFARLLQYGDVFITSGADASVRARVADHIVGGDVELLVAPDGSRFWVNGKPYQSRTEAEEAALPDYRASCEDPLGTKPASEVYQRQDAEGSGD